MNQERAVLWASLVIRQQCALGDEGIGPLDPQESDQEILAEAVTLAGHLFRHHTLWDYGVVTEDEHRTYCRTVSPDSCQGYKHDWSHL